MENKFLAYQYSPKNLPHQTVEWGGEYFMDGNGNRIILMAKTLDDLNDDFEKIKKEGHSCIHVPISWSKAEPKEPFQYSEEYFSHIDKIVDRADKAGLHVVFDMDLDMPRWVYDVVGFDVNTMHKHKSYVENFTKTFFFDSESETPRVLIEGIFADKYLLRAYGRYLKAFAKRHHEKKNVLAFQLIKEPELGFIGRRKITKEFFEEIKKGDGHDTDEERAWKDDTPCPLQEHGVWEIDKKGKAKIVMKSHFAALSFWMDIIVKRFHTKSKRAIKSVAPNKLVTLGKKTTEYTTSTKPHPKVLCGTQHRMKFDPKKNKFTLKFKRDESCNNNVTIFLPHPIYGKGANVSYTSGKCDLDEANSLLKYYPGQTSNHTITVEPMSLPLEVPKGKDGLDLSSQ